MKRVLIIQQVMKQYRLPLYNKLNSLLSEHKIDLKVAYSSPNDLQNSKGGNVSLPVEYGQQINCIRMFDSKLILQFPILEILRADLIIVEQANKHLVNYFLIILSLLKLKKLAFWGHGFDHQKRGENLSSKLKRFLLTKSDWWFAYTSEVANYVAANAFDPSKITNVENSIDTKEFSKLVNSVSKEELDNLRYELGIAENSPVCLYCGSMYKEKEISFLVESLKVYRDQGGEAYFLFIGAGPDEYIVKEFVKDDTDSKYLGTLFDKSKARIFALADVLINPGLMGLGILDAFSAGVPVLTTNAKIHSPEIEYLENGVNGIVCEYDVKKYASNLKSILCSDQLERYKIKAKEVGLYHSIERMASNMCSGIVNALSD